MAVTADRSVVASSRILKEELRGCPYLTLPVLKHILRSELSIPLLLNRDYRPTKITLGADRIKQAIKETLSREEVREIKTAGGFTPTALNKMLDVLQPLNALMHVFWREVEIARKAAPDAGWFDSNVFMTDSQESSEWKNISFTLTYGP